MFAGAGLAVINLLFAFFKLEEPPLTAEARSANRTKRFDLDNIRRVLSDPRTRLAIGLFFLVTFAVTQMEVTFAIYLKALFGLDAQHAGELLALMGIIMVGVQGGAIGKLAKRYGEIRLIIVGTLLCAVSLAAFGAVTTCRPSSSPCRPRARARHAPSFAFKPRFQRRRRRIAEARRWEFSNPREAWRASWVRRRRDFSMTS